MRIFINVRNSIRKILREEIELEPKVGDFLYCHTDVVMVDDGILEATKGKSYQIIDKDSRAVTIKNNSNHYHTFTLGKDSDSYYGIWFELIPPDIKDIDFFGQLYESEEFDWVKELTHGMDNIVDVVSITNPGKQYSHHLEAMAALNVPEAAEHIKHTRKPEWAGKTNEMRENGILVDDVNVGDICYLTSDSYICHFNKSHPRLYHLIRKSDGKHLVMSSEGFEPYNLETIKEQEDDLQWAKDLVRDMGEGIDVVIVTNRGQQYSSHLEAMAYLGVPEAEERLKGIREREWYDECSDMEKKGILGDARDGDICYLMPGSYGDIYHLVRISDKKHFILNSGGFKRYNAGVIKEQEDEFEWARDIIKQPIKVLVVGQTYRVNLKEKEKAIIDLMIIEMDENYIWDNSKAVIINPETSSMSSEQQREFLKDYNRKRDKSEISNANRLLKDGHWIPIPIENSLFKDDIQSS